MAIGISDAWARQEELRLSDTEVDTAGTPARLAYPGEGTVLDLDSAITDMFDTMPPSS